VHRSGQPEVIRSMVANGYGYTLINARPVNEQALDGRPLRTVPLDGSPRAMVLGLASLAGARPTRVVTAFRDHCREAVASGTLPGLGADGR
jgi:DNA-binding transcriptional LysR family regulator